MISTVFEVIAPVALIVLAGFFAVKLKFFPQEGVKFVMNFAQNFAVPLLLFNAVREVDFQNNFNPSIWFAYFIPALVIFISGVALARLMHRDPQSSVVLGFNALFANSLLLGLPLSERAFGADSLINNYMILAVHSPFGYITGAIAMEFAKPKGANWRQTFQNIGNELATNPLLIGILLGFIVNLMNIHLPKFLDDAISMQSRAALPVALFGLGGVLTRLHLRGAMLPVVSITSLRMIAHPILVLLCALFVFKLPIDAVKTLVLTAAMPTGVNGFIFASIYQREEETAASIVFFGTLISLLTVPIWLILLNSL